MSKNAAPNSVISLIVVIAALVVACVVVILVSDVRVLGCLTAVAVGIGVGCQYLFPANEEDGAKAGNDTVVRSIGESRNEVINAMSILQQEIRLLQAAGGNAADKKALRDEISHLSTEVAALKLLVQGSRK